MAAEIPSPEEIIKVTEYLQASAATAQEQIVAAKKAAAEVANQAATDLIAQNNVSGITIERKPWEDESISWQNRGDILSIRLDFDDGNTAVVMSESGDALDLQITPAP